MEGKALLFKYLGGVDAFPICLDTKDPEEFIRTVKLLTPSFGGINLEDIENPKCFYILDRLRAEAPIPVWHDDQQGTAAVTVAGLINALKIVGKKMEDARITMIGVGAANVCIARMLFKAGADPKKMMVVDSKGILSTEAGRHQCPHPQGKAGVLPDHERRERADGDIAEAMKGQDVVIALSKPGPDVIEKEWVAADGRQRDCLCLRKPDSGDMALGGQGGGRTDCCYRAGAISLIRSIIPSVFPPFSEAPSMLGADDYR